MPVWERRGKMVIPACPPTTGTLTSATPLVWCTKAVARMVSKVVTPKILEGLYTPLDCMTLERMGTVELTGLEMTKKAALGQCSAQASAKVLTIPALVSNKS